MNKYAEVLYALSEAPDGQIDASQTIVLRDLAKREDTPHSDELKAVLDKCAYAALASDFAMMAMDAVWTLMLLDESHVK